MWLWQNIAAISVLRWVTSTPFTAHEHFHMIFANAGCQILRSGTLKFAHPKHCDLITLQNSNKWHKLGFGAVSSHFVLESRSTSQIIRLLVFKSEIHVCQNGFTQITSVQKEYPTSGFFYQVTFYDHSDWRNICHRIHEIEHKHEQQNLLRGVGNTI